jgi:hypothetical protein
LRNGLLSTKSIAVSILATLVLLVFQGFLLTNIQAGDNDHPIRNGFINASGGLPVGTSQHAIWFGDIDNDTFPDIATAGYSGVRAWIGDGDGNWTLASTGLPTNTYDGGVCMGDINNDGHIDIAAANYDFGIGSVAVWTGDGTGSWTPASTGLPAGGWYTGIHLADMNNDKNLDMAFGNENFGIRVYMGTGTGVWSDVSTNLPTTGAYYSVWMDDVNHDNYTDLVAAGSGMHVWLGNGAGVWTEASNGLPWTDMWSGVTVGDINLDGHMDIAASMDQSGHGLRVWLGDGTSNWTAASYGLPITGLYYGVVIEDMIGDKYPDLLVAGYAGTTAVEIWEGDGGNSWTKYPGFLPTGEVIGVAAGDIDKNGYMDIAAAGEGFGVQVWKNDATTLPLKVDVDIPNGGESWIAGSQHQVNWSAFGGSPPLTIKIEYSTDGLFGQYTMISDGEINDGTYLWDVPNTPSTDCYIRVNATDSAVVKNWDKSDLSFTILPAETFPPTISNLLPLNQTITGDTTPTISASYSDASGIDVASVVLEVDSIDMTASATVTPTDVSYTPSIPLADGVHDIYLEVKDDSINQNKAKASWWFRVDTQPPTISNEQPANESTTGDSTPTIGAWYDDVSGIDTSSVLLMVDASDVTPLASITPTGVLYTPIAPMVDGMHNVSLEVSDNSTPANTGVMTWWFIVDTTIVDVTPPNITNLQPADQTVIENELPNIGASYDDLSGIDTGSVFLSVDLVDVTLLASVTPLDVTYTPATPLTQGVHNIYLSLEDDSPNRNEAEASWRFEVNTLPPSITNTLPLNESFVNDNTPEVSASYSDDSGIDTSSVTLKIDSIDVTGLATITPAGITFTPISPPLSEGVHDVLLSVGDQSNLPKTTTVTWWFTVDTVPPTITNLTPEDGSIIGDEDPQIGADIHDDVSGIDSFGILFNFENQDTGGMVVGTFTILPLATGIRFDPDILLPDGNYCAHLEVSDMAGNRAMEDWCFSVDTTPPIIANQQPADLSVITTSTPVISATFHDATGINASTILLKLDSIDVTGSSTKTASSISFTLLSGLSEGLHTVDLYVEDISEPSNAANATWSFTISTQTEDTDGDGLPDDWEISHFGDLSQNPGNDSDGDGLTNVQEYNLDTDPTNADTDGDGLSDSEDPNPLVPKEEPSGGVDPILYLVIVIIVVVIIVLLWLFVFKRKIEHESDEEELVEEESQEPIENE